MVLDALSQLEHLLLPFEPVHQDDGWTVPKTQQITESVSDVLKQLFLEVYF
jgi:hypothetical protein